MIGGGACDGMTFDLRPGQRVVTGFDGRFAHVYELDDGELLFVGSYPAEEFDWTSFKRKFAQRTEAIPFPDSIAVPIPIRGGFNQHENEEQLK
jgi:hypothetical protein